MFLQLTLLLCSARAVTRVTSDTQTNRLFTYLFIYLPYRISATGGLTPSIFTSYFLPKLTVTLTRLSWLVDVGAEIQQVRLEGLLRSVSRLAG